jgi:hypothetical protein
MEKKMSIPTGGNAFLHELELTVTTELTQAETGQPYEEAIAVPIDEWLSDPADAQRYEVGLRSLLGAVEALEDSFGPGDHRPPADVPESARTAGCSPTGPGRFTETEGW